MLSEQSTTPTTLIPKGFNTLDKWLPELQSALAGIHRDRPLVLIGVPYHKLPDDKKVPELSRSDVIWFTGNKSGWLLDIYKTLWTSEDGYSPLGLTNVSRFTSIRTLERTNSEGEWIQCKPSWASALAKEHGFPFIGDLGSGKLSIHNTDGGIIHYYKDKTDEEIKTLLHDHSDVPIFATGTWRNKGIPEGYTNIKLLSHEDEARYTAASVSEYIDGSFTMIEMGKGSTQIVSYDRKPWWQFW